MLFLVEKLYLLFVSFGPVIGQFCSGGCHGLPTIALNLIYLVSHKTNSQSKTERLKDEMEEAKAAQSQYNGSGRRDVLLFIKISLSTALMQRDESHIKTL